MVWQTFRIGLQNPLPHPPFHRRFTEKADDVGDEPTGIRHWMDAAWIQEWGALRGTGHSPRPVSLVATNGRFLFGESGLRHGRHDAAAWSSLGKDVGEAGKLQFEFAHTIERKFLQTDAWDHTRKVQDYFFSNLSQPIPPSLVSVSFCDFPSNWSR